MGGGQDKGGGGVIGIRRQGPFSREGDWHVAAGGRRTIHGPSVTRLFVFIMHLHQGVRCGKVGDKQERALEGPPCGTRDVTFLSNH